MKKISLFLAALTIMAMAFSCGDGSTAEPKENGAKQGAAADTKCGFKVDGENVIFMFDEAIYSGQLLDDIETVTVAGEFQGWDPTAADWHATKGENGIWTFTAPLSTCPCGSKFKFVVNDIDWMQPDTSLDPKYLTDDGVGGFNLVMACE